MSEDPRDFTVEEALFHGRRAGIRESIQEMCPWCREGHVVRDGVHPRAVRGRPPKCSSWRLWELLGESDV
jgi:hypothetical protein